MESTNAPSPAKRSKACKMKEFQKRNPAHDDEEANLQRALELSTSEREKNSSLKNKFSGSSHPTMTPKPKTELSIHLPVTVLHRPLPCAGPNPGEQDEGQAGSNPGDVIESQLNQVSMRKFTTTSYPNVKGNQPNWLTEDHIGRRKHREYHAEAEVQSMYF
ncbi:hypothetical protein Tco_0438381 [Tanacetum coccineum]